MRLRRTFAVLVLLAVTAPAGFASPASGTGAAPVPEGFRAQAATARPRPAPVSVLDLSGG